MDGPLLPWVAQTAQKIKFMLSHMAHKATVYKAGELTQGIAPKLMPIATIQLWGLSHVSKIFPLEFFWGRLHFLLTKITLTQWVKILLGNFKKRDNCIWWIRHLKKAMSRKQFAMSTFWRKTNSIEWRAYQIWLEFHNLITGPKLFSTDHTMLTK